MSFYFPMLIVAAGAIVALVVIALLPGMIREALARRDHGRRSRRD
jgi:zinc transporter ZupT